MTPRPTAAAPMTATDLGARAVARCDLMGSPPYSERENQLIRRYLTTEHAAALSTLGEWMSAAGMSVRCDATGNLIGRHEGTLPGAPALMIGSHIDTVRNGGRYDGALGVMLGIDCVEALAGRRLPFAIEVIAFGDEEGSRFPASMGCSRAVAGKADGASLEMMDAEGISVAQARAAFAPLAGGVAAERRSGEILAFLEAHIEQGPVLEAENLAIGVVTAIAAQKRLMVRIGGMAGHAGTTPMHLRRDPAPAAAEAILAVERLCGGEEGLVGTVGRITALPGSINVIPGAVEFSMDIRAPTSPARDRAVARVTAAIEEIAARRGLTLSIELMQTLAESPCDSGLIAMLEQAVGDLGVAPRRLPSGAAHDAMSFEGFCPSAMLFIRCRGGISHNPAEHVEPADAAMAARAMLGFIDILARAQGWSEGAAA